MIATADNAHRIIVTSSYDEKQQGLVDSMLVTWSDIEGYNETYRTIDRLTEEQQIDVAQNILYRREDREQ